MRRMVLAAGVAVAMLWAPAAMASTAQVATGYFPASSGCSKYMMCEYRYVTVNAAPGEANDLTLTSAGSTVSIRDAGAPLTAGPGCTRVDDQSATCPAGFFLRVFAGDGDDKVTVAREVGATVRGGSGDDLLLGGNGHDFLHGEGGTDTLRGGAGADSLSDDDKSGSANADVLDGGDGEDLVTYGSRTRAVTVDLRGSSPSGGEEDEGDSLQGIENVDGGAGDDVLRAGDAPAVFHAARGHDRLVGGASGDVLMGSAGRDRMVGRGGRDLLSGRAGRDRLSGGSSRDWLAGGAGRDRIVGGAGRDRIAGGGGADMLFARDGRADAVIGGTGRDRARTDRRDRVRLVERLF